MSQEEILLCTRMAYLFGIMTGAGGMGILFTVLLTWPGERKKK